MSQLRITSIRAGRRAWSSSTPTPAWPPQDRKKQRDVASVHRITAPPGQSRLDERSAQRGTTSVFGSTHVGDRISTW